MPSTAQKKEKIGELIEEMQRRGANPSLVRALVDMKEGRRNVDLRILDSFDPGMGDKLRNAGVGRWDSNLASMPIGYMDPFKFVNPNAMLYEDPRNQRLRGDMPDDIRRALDEGGRAVRELAVARTDLKDAGDSLKELQEILERVQKEPLILYKIDRLSKDKKHAYVKKQDTDLRIEACPDLESGDEVLLHPKTFQIVERVGKPPLEVSRFAPDSVPDVKWDDIGGLEEAKLDMIEAIELPHKNKELFAYYGKKQIKGILLSGPPGCGKTMLGKAAAKCLSDIYGVEGSRTGFLYVKGPEILNQYVGQTEQTIRDMFDDARRHKEENGYPAIIFLDEADAILAARGTRNVGIGNTIVPQFLTEMDGLEESGAIVIIATNRPDVLDPAIVRDGRIDRKVTVTRPNAENAGAILKLNFKKVPLEKGLAVDDAIVMATKMMYSDDVFIKPGVLLRDIVNGAMLANCVNLAISSALRRDMKLEMKKGSGVNIEDIKAAILRVAQQSVDVRHDLETHG